MTKEQYHSLIEFFKEQDQEETLQQTAFRILCFYYENKEPKDWVSFEQLDNEPIYQAKLILPTVGLSFSFQEKVKDVLDKLYMLELK